MSSPIEVLMIDDDKENFDSLRNFAADQRIILRYSKSLDLGIQELKSNKRLLAVILDGKGFLKSDQEKGSESSNFVHEALTQLTILEKDQNRFIPKCVLTAWYAQLQESLDGRVDIFDKKKIALDADQKRMMFSSLKEQVIKSDEYKIRNNYSDIFEVVGYLMSPKVDAALYTVMEAVEKNKCNKNDFVLVRDIFEAVLKRLNQDDIKLIPDNLFKKIDGRPNLEYCIRYLKGWVINDPNDKSELLYPQGEPKVPAHVSSSLTFVKETSSALSHDYSSKFTLYSFKASAFALCEMLVWLREFHSSLRTK